MSPCPESARRSVDEQPCLPLGMDHACVAWQGASVEDPRALAMAIDALEVQGTFVVLADDVLASDRHLAAAVGMAHRRWERGRAVGRTLGGGTHALPCREPPYRRGDSCRRPSGRSCEGMAGRIGAGHDETESLLAHFGFTPCAPHTMTVRGGSGWASRDGRVELLALGLVAEADLLA